MLSECAYGYAGMVTSKTVSSLHPSRLSRWQIQIDLITIPMRSSQGITLLTRCATRVDGGDESFAGNTKPKRSSRLHQPPGGRGQGGEEASGRSEELIWNDYQLLLLPDSTETGC